MLKELSIKTTKTTELSDITAKVQRVVSDSRISEGICIIYVPHTTAGVTINENADPSVVRDILYELDKVIPLNDGYAHAEGNSAAHIKSSLTGNTQEIIISNGKLVLGTWQGIYFAEYDGPRNRKILLKIIKG